MKKEFLDFFGLIVVGSLWLAATPAAADSVGPYYATPSWDQTLPSSTRFIVLSNFNSEAVLDRETGLVWEKSPSTTFASWYDQSSHCLDLNNGGRTGWRLPTVQELLSLVDRSQLQTSLPSGHPFSVQSNFYWSATTAASLADNAWGMGLNLGGHATFTNKSNGFLGWCVRGGPGVDPQ